MWAALRQLRPGSTTTYGAIAQDLGSVPRAVGRAVASNRIALAVPCHRVVRGDGGLGGYAWGLGRKEALLRLEREGRGQLSLLG